MRSSISIVAVGLLAAVANPAHAALVAHWPLDEGSGYTTVADVAGGGHTGTMQNFNGDEWITDPAELPPILGGTTAALRFDGPGAGNQEYIVATGYKGISGTDPRTMTAWIRTPSTGDLNRDIITWGNDSGGQKWHFRVQSSNGQAGAIRVEVNGGYVVGSTSVADGAWHHVAAVLPPSTSANVNQVALFVDGLYNGTSAEQGRAINTASGADVRIGTGHQNRYFPGAMADVRIYDHAFSHTEMHQFVHGPGVPIAHWALGDAAGPALNAGTLGAAADGTYRDTSKSGNEFNPAHRSVPGLLAGGHTGTATYFDGGGGMSGAGSKNTGPRISVPSLPGLNEFPSSLPLAQRTIEVTFSPEDVYSPDWGRRILYAEGGTTYGLSIYVRDNSGSYELWVGGWNGGSAADPGSPWGAAFFGTPISLQNPFTVQLVLDGAADAGGSPTGSLIGYINGREFGQASDVGYLYNRGAATIGGAAAQYRIDTGNTTANGHWFHGIIDEVRVYNETPTAGDVAARYASIQPYMNAVLDDNPIAYWRLGEKTTNTAGNLATPLYGDGIGRTVDGTYAGNIVRSDAGLLARDPNGAAYFDGASRVTIPNHSKINTAGAGYDAKTVEMWFQADDTSGRQVLYEQGGSTNGLNLYVHDGSLYLGAWAGNAGTWGAWLDTPIEAERRYHVALVYDNETGVDGFRGMVGYLDGLPFMTLAADDFSGTFGTLPTHTDAVAIAGVNGNTRFHDNVTTGQHYFTGLIDEVALYNYPLSAEQIWNHYAIGVPEPSSALLALLGMLLLLIRRRRP